MTITKQQVEGLIEKLAVRLEGEITGATFAGRDNIPNPFRQHPILIGDIMERCEFDDDRDELVKSWGWLGYTSSLQEIAEQIKWEADIPKPSWATDLFEFLLTLKL